MPMSNAMGRELFARAWSSFEDHRQRIATQLHEESCQELSAISMVLASLEGVSSSHESASRLDQLREMLRQLTTRFQELAFELRPRSLDDFGLEEALLGLVDSLRPNFEIKVQSQIATRRFPEKVEVALYRIVQEALSNVDRHARALRVSIRMAIFGDCLVLSVADNGCGFPFQGLRGNGWKHHVGLLSMWEMAGLAGGTLRVRSKPGKGTIVRVRVPATPREVLDPSGGVELAPDRNTPSFLP